MAGKSLNITVPVCTGTSVKPNPITRVLILEFIVGIESQNHPQSMFLHGPTCSLIQIF